MQVSPKTAGFALGLVAAWGIAVLCGAAAAPPPPAAAPPPAVPAFFVVELVDDDDDDDGCCDDDGCDASSWKPAGCPGWPS